MIQCLFAIEDTIPLTPNFTGGASALAYSHLQLLAHAGAEIHTIIFCRDIPSSQFEAYTKNYMTEWRQIRDWCASHDLFRVRFITRRSAPLRSFIESLVDHSLRFTRINDTTRTDLTNVITQLAPDLIWAEDLSLASIFQKFFPEITLVYSHHDWKWKIKGLRHRNEANTFLRSVRRTIRHWLMRQHERALVRQVSACVSASGSEVKDMLRLGAKEARYFPTLYPPTPPPVKPVPEQPRIVHLGGMQTTANRIGLKRFLQVTWPVIKCHFPSPPPLWVIGSLDGADQELHQLLDQSSAICTGYVEDLDTVLRPYDLHIIPWEHNTGTRTRIPLMLSYGQVVVSTYASAACLPELKHNDNAVLVRNLQDMAREICDLLADDVRRKQIGLAGHELFLSNYTREAVQPRFDKFIADILNNGSHKNGFAI